MRCSPYDRQGAAQLTQDVTDKLVEAEEQCRDSLQSEWDECRPCLEDACKTFYRSTCRRGFAAFHAKVGNRTSMCPFMTQNKNKSIKISQNCRSKDILRETKSV